MDEQGVKFDGDKTRMDLIPFNALEEVGKVLTFGAKKYAPDNWKKVPDATARYEAALLRHFAAYKKGEINDPETGLSHLAHLTCNALFLLWFQVNKGAILTTDECTFDIDNICWSDIPAIYEYLAADKNGAVIAYTIEPFAAETIWLIKSDCTYETIAQLPPMDDWKNSLRKRP